MLIFLGNTSCIDSMVLKNYLGSKKTMEEICNILIKNFCLSKVCIKGFHCSLLNLAMCIYTYLFGYISMSILSSIIHYSLKLIFYIHRFPHIIPACGYSENKVLRLAEC